VTYNYHVNPVYPASGEKNCSAQAIAITCPVLNCNVDLTPNSITLDAGGESNLVAAVSGVQGGTVEKVTFSLSPATPVIATFNPTEDSSYVYSSTVTGVLQGSANIEAKVYFVGVSDWVCKDSSPLTVRAPKAWFQTQEGDVHATTDIRDSIPSSATNKTFSFNEVGNYPGVVSYFGASPQFGSMPPVTVSSQGWLAKTGLTGRTFSFFYALVGSPTTVNFHDGDPLPTATGIYYATGNITLAGGAVGSGKVVIFVKNQGGAKVTIQGNITVAKGGFLAIITEGDIDVQGAVSRIEGFFSADGQFATSTGATAFVGEGIFLANSFSFGRNLVVDNKKFPAEKFIFRPDLLMNARDYLWLALHSWEELAP